MPIRLDERLSLIAALSSADTVADIGCDHGKLSYYLVSTGRAGKVIATDISVGSLEKARRLAEENGAEQIETRLGDGLKPLNSREADVVVIAGLGGDVVSRIILSAAADGKEFAHFVLSPNTHAEKVRGALIKIGHAITFDDVVFSGNKAYPILRSVEKTADVLDETQIKYGKFYKTSRGFKKYVYMQIEQIEKKVIVLGGGSEKLSEKLRELKLAAVMSEISDDGNEK